MRQELKLSEGREEEVRGKERSNFFLPDPLMQS